MPMDQLATTGNPAMADLLDQALRRAALHRPVYPTDKGRRDNAPVQSMHDRLRDIRALTPPCEQIDSLELLRAIRDE